MSAPSNYGQSKIETERRQFPRRIILLCGLSGIFCLTYTILMMNFNQNSAFEKWIEKSRPAISIVYSMLLNRTNLSSHDETSVSGNDLDVMVHVYAFSWIIGFSFFVLLILTSLIKLRDYYIAVSLPKYSKNKPLIDHIAWRWGGILGCWAGASYGGELNSIFPRTFFSSLFVPLMFYFVLAFTASLLAYIRFQRHVAHDPSRR